MSTRRRIVASCTTAALLVGGVGCGGGGAGSYSSPTATVKTYLTSVADGDGAAACSALAPAVQTTVLQAAHAQNIKASSCADLFGQVKSHMNATQRRQFLGAKVTVASMSGNTATVNVAGASSRPTLQKQGGKWLITGGIGL